ncbi:hypothetical protein DCC81_09505 [Chitinophaga parva]|uniref:YdhG-like domain-containing protein n=1 Tax=Chitinophaga parva TaxID=2169414 RepID=A0A2T7BPQ1_9BACT|nr:DUF1801 domain-containing protein [Chitinophaga parva]PUZ29655.1 hypothetical protein DCC81_09505 [Chitinophaga parva]
MQHYPDVDTYIASYPTATRRLLEQMRTTIRKAAPQAEEVISYGMPAYSLGTKLVYFGGHQQHIGFYPTASGIREFEQELSRYKFSKGAVQFPLDKPLPLALITRIVKMRLKKVTEQQALPTAAAPSPFATLAAPAQRALLSHHIKTLKQLAKHSEAEILAFHGVGPGSIPSMRKLLADAGLHFKA